MISVTRATWLMNRLGSMGPGEIFSRLAEVGRHAILSASLQRIENRAGTPNRVQPDCDTPVIQIRMPNIADGKSCLEIENADRCLRHEANFFSLSDVYLGASIDWHRDYSSGITSPLKYSGLINHRVAAVAGDVKYIWELNRLQHLVVLAVAFSRTGKSLYKEEIVSQTLSWIAHNPFMMGANWKSPLEAAIRLISWALVSCLIGNDLPENYKEGLRRTIYLHQYFIWKFYSKHSSANNHLIGEMAGLYVASVIWPFYRESNSWQSIARQALIQEIKRQVEADGVGKERATEYQLFVIEFFLIAGALGHAIGDSFPHEYWQRLNRMIGFLSAISDGNGNLPMFGDGDSGQVIALPETLQTRTKNLVRLGLPRCQSRHDGIDTATRARLLLWGRSSADLPLESNSDQHQGLRTFPHGGYYVLVAGQNRDAATKIVFDAGPLGLAPLYAHGHADALSFWLSYGGHEFLVDPGTFSYYREDLWRAYFRSTAAHNTIRIDGKDQSDPIGRFQWSNPARSQVESFKDTDEVVELVASHDGYNRLTNPVIHRRRLSLFKHSKQLRVIDQLGFSGAHDVEVFFHFHEDCHVRQVGTDSFIAEVGDRRLNISLDSRLEPQLLRGSEHPIAGWVSRTYGVKTPSFTLIGRGSLTGPQSLLTEIRPA